MVLAGPLVSLSLGIILHAFVATPTPTADANTYHSIATGLIGQNQDPYYGFHWASVCLAVRSYVYPVLAGGVYWTLNGPHPGAVGWIQAIVFVPLTTYVIYKAGLEAFSHRIGLLASWTFALWFPAVWHSLWLMTETLLNLMMAIVMALLAAVVCRKSAKLGVLCGLAVGVLSITHSAYQFLPFALYPVFLAHLYFYDRGHLRLAMYFLIGILLIQVPYQVTVVAKQLPTLGEGARGCGGGGGWTFWEGSRPETDFARRPEDFAVADLSAPGQLILLGERIARDEVQVEPHLLRIIEEKLSLRNPMDQTLTDGDFYRAGIENLLEHPLKWPRKLRVNAFVLFGFPSRMLFYPPDPTEATWFRGPWRMLNWLLNIGSALGAVFLLWKRRDRLILFAPFAFQAALILAALAENRYVIPFWSSMFLLTSIGIFGWLEMFSRFPKVLEHSPGAST